MIMSYYDHFLDLSTVCDVTISVSATSQKVFVAW